MKKYISVICLFTFFACGRTETKIVFEKDKNYKEIIDNSKEPSQNTQKNATISDDDASIMLGTWVGEMNGKKLTVVIEQINQNEIIGYNILGTNKRPLKGLFSDGGWAVTCSKSFDAILNEPGDDKWDGVFTITFVGYEDERETEDGPECIGNLEGAEAVGTWKSNNGKVTWEFNLEKKK